MKYNSCQCANCSGKHIRIARNNKGFSQDQLAARMQVRGLDVSRRVISRIEIGARIVPDYGPPLFADALGVSVLWLLRLED